jgi:hypothetical protein
LTRLPKLIGLELIGYHIIGFTKRAWKRSN